MIGYIFYRWTLTPCIRITFIPSSATHKLLLLGTAGHVCGEMISSLAPFTWKVEWAGSNLGCCYYTSNNSTLCRSYGRYRNRPYWTQITSIPKPALSYIPNMPIDSLRLLDTKGNIWSNRRSSLPLLEILQEHTAMWLYCCGSSEVWGQNPGQWGEGLSTLTSWEVYLYICYKI